MSGVEILKNGKNICFQHLDRRGNIQKYDTPFQTEEEGREFIRQTGLDKVVKLAEMNALTKESMTRVISGSNRTILEYVDEWINKIKLLNEPTTVESYERNFRLWVREEQLENKSPNDITEQQVYDFINGNSDRKAATRKIYLQAIRSFFKFCVSRGYCLSDPSQLNRVRMRGLKHSQKEPKQVSPITSGDVDNLLSYVKGVRNRCLVGLRRLEQQTSRSPKKQETLTNRYDMYRFWETAIILAHETALRFSDIIALEWECFKGDSIIVWTEKRDTRVEIPISKRLKEALGEIPIYDLEYCFPYQKKMPIAKLSTYFKRLCNSSGVDGKSFHGLRHGTLQRWREEGTTLEDLAKMAGHTSTKTTEGYL